MIKRIQTGQRMSHIVINGNTVYLSGQVGNPISSVAGQTQECLDKIESLLDQAGSNKDQILQAVIWLADMADFEQMNTVWDAWVTPDCAPARACGEAKLARDELKVEIIITAAC